MKELKKSLKRIYTRFVVLTALVVFGAIAIAQGNKDQGLESPPMNSTAQTLQASVAQPIPNNDGVSQASFEEPMDIPDLPAALPPAQSGSMDETDEPDAWGEIESQPVSSALPEADPVDAIGYDDALPEETDSAPRQNPFRNAQAQPDSLPADDGYDDALLDPPPLLPEDSAAAVDGYDDLEVGVADPPPASDFDQPAYEIPEGSYDPPASGGDLDVPSYNEPTYDESIPSYDDPTTEAPAADYNEAGYDQGDYAAPGEDGAYAVPEYDTAIESQPVEPAPVAPRATQQPNANSRTAPRAAPSNHTQAFPQRETIDGPSVPSMNLASRSESLASSTGRPGPQTMEGIQTPTVTVQKLAPEEVQVGQTATFEIRVRNIGRVTADNIVVRDEIPAGTKFIDSTPKVTRAENGALYWDAGSLPPGQEYSIEVQVVPLTEGQVGSVATVSFEASASARTMSTKPALVLEHTGPKKVLVGDKVRFQIKLSNPGTGKASNVVLEEDVPKGLSHSSGPKLEYEVGTIQPGQTRHLELVLRAAQAGDVLNTLVARADGGLSVEDVSELEVVKPQLSVNIEGPGRRYLERKATYTVSVSNPGTAPAKNVELTARLPRSLKFVSTNNSGYYDQNLHAVIWSLEQLPAGEMGRAQFTAMPIEMGDFQIQADGKAAMGLEDSREHAIRVEGIAALLFTLQDQVDPIEVGGQTSYLVRVVNQGSKDATNVQISAAVPNGMRPLEAEGPTTEQIQDQQIVFAPIDRLPAKGEVTYKILVQGTEANDYRIRVRMTSDDIATPVIKEESTRVYSD